MAHNPDLNDAELLMLAKDIEAGVVFTAGAVPLDDQEMLPQIFSDMTQEDSEKEDMGLIYQYADKATEGVRVNDYPIFEESLWLNREQVVRTMTLLFSNARA
jgi:hypothetical protein